MFLHKKTFPPNPSTRIRQPPAQTLPQGLQSSPATFSAARSFRQPHLHLPVPVHSIKISERLEIICEKMLRTAVALVGCVKRERTKGCKPLSHVLGVGFSHTEMAYQATKGKRGGRWRLCWEVSLCRVAGVVYMVHCYMVSCKACRSFCGQL